jgi:mRNA-degrading endonuclease toxin of MazEF toxin-antitoxin module
LYFYPVYGDGEGLGAAESQTRNISRKDAKAAKVGELSVANIQGIGSIPAIRLQRKLGSLSTETRNKIKQALRSALDL